MKFIARPIDPVTRNDRLGTDDVIGGEYKTYGNFLRFAMNRHARPGIEYRIYKVTNGHWHAIECY